jgi:hypothetical protein
LSKTKPVFLPICHFQSKTMPVFLPVCPFLPKTKPPSARLQTGPWHRPELCPCLALCQTKTQSHIS